VKKILVFALPGIGDTLLFTPALHALRKGLPSAEIAVFVMYRGGFEALEHNPDIDRLIFWEFFEKGFWRSLFFLLRLRRERFDASILSFPSNRIHYNVTSFLVGARLRIVHRYRNQSIRNLYFLNNRTVKENGEIHNVEENYRLLQFLGIQGERNLNGLHFTLEHKDKSFADEYLKSFDKGKILVGMHAWSTELKEMWRKCWDSRHFARLIDSLHSDGKYQVLLFEGPHDRNTNKRILNESKNPPFVVQGISLRETAAIISKCHIFVTNDSGLMHVAAAVNTPTVAIFGPTNPRRLHPFKVEHVNVRKDLACSPCFYYSPNPLTCMWGDFRCLEWIGVEEVKGALENLLQRVGNLPRE
jgi:heptosyltransferase-2